MVEDPPRSGWRFETDATGLGPSTELVSSAAAECSDMLLKLKEGGCTGSAPVTGALLNTAELPNTGALVTLLPNLNGETGLAGAAGAPPKENELLAEGAEAGAAASAPPLAKEKGLLKEEEGVVVVAAAVGAPLPKPKLKELEPGAVFEDPPKMFTVDPAG